MKVNLFATERSIRLGALLLAMALPSFAQTVSPSDIVMDLDANKPLMQQDWYYQCAGIPGYHASTLTSQGLFTGTQPSGIAQDSQNTPWKATSQRIGVTALPSGATTTNAIMLRVRGDDPLSAGSPRCEIVFINNAQTSYLPTGNQPASMSDFWQATKLWVEDWSLASNDEQLIYQWHDSSSTAVLNPLLALFVRGDTARLNLRWETTGNTTVDKSTVANTDVWIGSAKEFFSGQWATIVVQARISTKSTDQPYLKFWINGALLASYNGPLGYNLPGEPTYGKLGVYHWVDDTNPWSSFYPQRSIYVHRAVTVLDKSGTYNESMLNALVQ